MFRGLKLLHGLRKSATVVFGFTEPLASMWARGLPETKVLSHVRNLHYYFRSRHGQPRGVLSQSSPTDYYCERGTRRLLSPTPWWSSKQLFVLEASRLTREYLGC
jgi:hypothetical protein